jgi:acetoin utilization deacetylase AcuC-like enzyme
MLRYALVDAGIITEGELRDAALISREDLLLAHTEHYIDGVINGSLDRLAQRRIGFPWSPQLVTRSLATVGGCLASARAALQDGVSGNLAGGTHHAMRDAGEGYCVFNDIAVATLKLMQEDHIRTALIIYLDVHQGNGNSDILGERNDVTIFSMHGAKNYPFRKIPSTIDIDLPDATGDEAYLQILGEHLPHLLDRAPDIVFYQCGVDPLEHDALGRLSMTFDGLRERDRMVLQACRDRHIPVMLALGGGYADPIEHTIAAQLNTYRVAKQIYANV